VLAYCFEQTSSSAHRVSPPSSHRRRAVSVPRFPCSTGRPRRQRDFPATAKRSGCRAFGLARGDRGALASTSISGELRPADGLGRVRTLAPFPSSRMNKPTIPGNRRRVGRAGGDTHREARRHPASIRVVSMSDASPATPSPQSAPRRGNPTGPTAKVLGGSLQERRNERGLWLSRAAMQSTAAWCTSDVDPHVRPGGASRGRQALPWWTPRRSTPRQWPSGSCRPAYWERCSPPRRASTWKPGPARRPAGVPTGERSGRLASVIPPCHPRDADRWERRASAGRLFRRAADFNLHHDGHRQPGAVLHRRGGDNRHPLKRSTPWR